MMAIKKIVPKNIKKMLNRTLNKFTLLRYLLIDYYRYSKYSFGIAKRFSKDHLRAIITINYHSIEKGLCRKQIRYRFGKNAMTKLVDGLHEYKKRGFDLNDSRYQSGISVIKEYINLHTKADQKLPDFLKIDNSILLSTSGINGGLKKINRVEETALDRNSLLKFVIKNRVSTRNFGEGQVEFQKVINALDLAANTPSVCNRQPWKVVLIENQDLIYKVLELQKGFIGFEENTRYIITVFQDFSYLSGPKERHQGYFDTGLFTMNLIYSLQSFNIASCIINAQFTVKEEKKMMKLLNYDKNMKMTCLVVLGSYKEEYYSAFSKKDSFMEFTKIIK